VALVIFDLDNTLIDRAAAVSRWAQQFADRHGLYPAEVPWLVEADGDGFATRAGFLGAVRERYGLAEPVETLVDSFRSQLVALMEPDPRVPPALDRLRRAGWRIAIATNGTTAQQSAKILRTGLDRHVDAVAVSEEVGSAKPEPRLFQVAAERCGHRLAEGDWMVGDCPIRDVAGAQRLGLRTVWLHRGRAWDPAATAPDAIVDHVSDTVAVLSGGAGAA
jgi:HAD superfamily hydrolase (TIGR01549 family)